MTQTDTEPWRDPARPAAERVADLLGRMTLEERVAQLGSVWMGASGDGDGVAPMQDQFFSFEQPPFEELIKNGIGQLTRVFGTRPVAAAAGVSALAALQARVAGASRLGIPAVAHEECLTGFAAWGATIFPTPLAWGAAFDPALVGEMSGGLRRHHARGRRPPGARAGARRDPRLPLGPHRGDHRRGSLTWSAPSAPSTCAGCSGPGSRPRSSTSPATPPRGPAGTWRRCPWGRAS